MLPSTLDIQAWHTVYIRSKSLSSVNCALSLRKTISRVCVSHVISRPMCPLCLHFVVFKPILIHALHFLVQCLIYTSQWPLCTTARTRAHTHTAFYAPAALTQSQYMLRDFLCLRSDFTRSSVVTSSRTQTGATPCVHSLPVIASCKL